MKLETCPKCDKVLDLCVCSRIRVLQSRHHVLILQHPQEPDKELGSAKIAHLSLPNSTLKVGLSWRNLGAALGRETQNNRWAVLYLGSGIKGSSRPEPGLTLVDKKGTPLPDQKKILSDLEGIVLLDGTWSQAKALWWRNAWLLKLRRAILTPTHASLYKELRREPRRECLSTIESVAECLDSLGENAEVGNSLRGIFLDLLNRARDRRKKR